MNLIMNLIMMKTFHLFHQPYIKKVEIKKFKDRSIDLRTILEAMEKNRD